MEKPDFPCKVPVKLTFILTVLLSGTGAATSKEHQAVNCKTRQLPLRITRV